MLGGGEYFREERKRAGKWLKKGGGNLLEDSHSSTWLSSPAQRHGNPRHGPLLMACREKNGRKIIKRDGLYGRTKLTPVSFFSPFKKAVTNERGGTGTGDFTQPTRKERGWRTRNSIRRSSGRLLSATYGLCNGKGRSFGTETETVKGLQGAGRSKGGWETVPFRPLKLERKELLGLAKIRRGKKNRE